MPEETQVAPTPATPTVAPAEEIIDLPINGSTFKLKEYEEAKGKSKGKLRYVLVPDVTDFPAWLARLRTAVGAENFDRSIMGLIREACHDATHDATVDGQVTDVNWAKAFLEQWLPTTRKSGEGIKDLRNKYNELVGKLSPLLLKQAQNELKVGTPEHNEMLQLLLDISDINEKIEGKSRKGKKEGAATPAPAK